MSEFIIESALLTHGLKSITNNRLKDIWDKAWPVAWLDEGQICVGGIELFCKFRDRAAEYRRINYFNFDQAIAQKQSGALTASGTMRICEIMGIPVAVTCGIGGLVQGQQLEQCNDLRALSQSGVSMVATSFKDMFDFEYTVKQAKLADITVCTREQRLQAGYLFDGMEENSSNFPISDLVMEKTLYLNPIPPEKRIRDLGILKKAIVYGKEQEREGNYFHPGVNAKIDELTAGMSSDIQLESLIQNIEWTQRLQKG